MLTYSVRKSRANVPTAYTILKTEMSSNFPSVRSNRAQLVSARVEINHIMASSQDGKISHKYS